MEILVCELRRDLQLNSASGNLYHRFTIFLIIRQLHVPASSVADTSPGSLLIYCLPNIDTIIIFERDPWAHLWPFKYFITRPRSLSQRSTATAVLFSFMSDWSFKKKYLVTPEIAFPRTSIVTLESFWHFCSREFTLYVSVWKLFAPIQVARLLSVLRNVMAVHESAHGLRR